jgi:hypothetical protein
MKHNKIKHSYPINYSFLFISILIKGGRGDDAEGRGDGRMITDLGASPLNSLNLIGAG